MTTVRHYILDDFRKIVPLVLINTALLKLGRI